MTPKPKTSANGITLKQLASNATGEANAVFEIWHQSGDSIIKEYPKVHIRAGQGAACEITISGCVAPTVDEAFDKLATWLRRFATAIEERKETTVSMPIY